MNGSTKRTASGIQLDIAKGTFHPHTALSNMAISYYQNAANYFAKAIFPVCPVRNSSDLYYIFDKEDLLRDNWKRKPAYGRVDPTVLSEHTDTYACRVDQMIMGIDQIRQTDLERRLGPGTIMNPKQQRARTIAEQANIHQDVLFANGFFKENVWNTEYTGVDNTSPSTGQFIKFSNANSDPVEFVDGQKLNMQRETGRTPNRLALGANVFKALRHNPAVKERVKYGGSTVNPAMVTANVLAQLFGVDRLVVLNSIRNKAEFGADAEMDFIGDPDAFLLAYATDSPRIDEPSAGYIFTWDMLGDGNLLPILNYVVDQGIYAEFVEGLMAYDMRKTAGDLAYFYKNAV